MQAVILAGGPLTDYTMVQVPADALLICADRGVRYAEQLGLHPDVMLGDFDSYGSIPAGEAVQVYPKEKDDTDLMLACRYAVGKGVKSVLIYGGLVVWIIQLPTCRHFDGWQNMAFGQNSCQKTIVPAYNFLVLVSIPDEQAGTFRCLP